MSKVKSQFICTNCNNISSKWSGQCDSCGSWDSITEYKQNLKIANFNKQKISNSTEEIQISTIGDDILDTYRIKTNIAEFDRVLGGGLVPSSTILIGGDPGVGKSTLILQILEQIKKQNIEAIYFSGEESANQIKLRAKRLDLDAAEVKFSTDTEVTNISNYIRKHPEIRFVVIDSIQTTYISELSAAPGSVTQLRNSTLEFTDLAKNNDIIFILIGHVTKDGQLAGPKLIEHMVDSVLYFEGEKSSDLRILRSYKNRYGATNELALFEMKANGLNELANPSEIFLQEYSAKNPGTTIFPLVEGSRTILLELQALVSNSYMASPRRAVVGWDNNRLAIILAVLNTRCNLNFSQLEVYFNVAGGIKITEPAADLAAAACLISAAKNKSLSDKTIIFGEIGLSGEVRNVNNFEDRLKEAKKLGFENAIIPKLHKKIDKLGLNLIEIEHISELLQYF